MHISQLWPRPPLLFGAAVFAAVALLLGRGVLPPQVSPALIVETQGEIRLALGEGFPSPGIRHFSDGSILLDVIKLTDSSDQFLGLPMVGDGEVALADGMALAIVEDPVEGRKLRIGWMTARQRLALGILLHPDRMSQDDWVMLPGIGEKLAAVIEFDRQKFGDFGRFEALERVKGIGPAKLRALRTFFVEIDK